MIKYAPVIFLTILSFSCKEQIKTPGLPASSKSSHDKEVIIEKYLKNGAWNYHFLAKEWNEWIDKGIQEDSTIAIFWQNKAIPLWKQQKYSLAIACYDKAVKLERQNYLARFAFLKCIFAKDYQSALVDFETYRTEFGTTVEQDHFIEFYMGICYLQLNQFEEAQKLFMQSIALEEKSSGNTYVHYLDRFYLAISFYQQKRYEEAIIEFDKVLEEYADFSDALYYKSICLANLDRKEEAKYLAETGELSYRAGKTFNEDSNLYEVYPYQVTWEWKSINYLIK
jgi:tetratricopeptide (TPR) repeat protein